MQWAERQMERAEEAGASIITVTHQNVLAQNRLLSQGFLLDHHEEMGAPAEKPWDGLNLSGHVHIQHIAENGGLMTLQPAPFGYVVPEPVWCFNRWFRWKHIV